MWKTIALWAIVLTILFVFCFPIVNTVLTSLKSKADISSRPPKWLFDPTLSHYQNVLYAGGYDFPLYYINSLIISLGASLVTVLICLPAAYSLVRFRTGGGNPLFIIMSLRLVPPIAFLIPIFIVFQYMRLTDTHLGMIFMNSLMNAPLGLLLFVGFVKDLPKEYEEAAMIDGASFVSIVRHIIFPLTLPGMAAVAMLTFIFSWNEFLMALVLTLRKAIPATVGAAVFVTAWEIKWGEIAAALAISMIPTMLFTYFTQRYLARAFTAGIVK